MMLFVLFFLILGVGWVASNWVKKAGGKAKYKSHCWNYGIVYQIVCRFATAICSVIACGVFTWKISQDERKYEYGSSLYIGWIGVGISIVFVYVTIQTWCGIGTNDCSAERHREYESI